MTANIRVTHQPRYRLLFRNIGNYAIRKVIRTRSGRMVVLHAIVKVAA